MSISDVSAGDNSYIEILKSFTRTTTINDLNDLMSKSLFMLYDLKDKETGKRDGKFDDKEWNLFEQFRNTVITNDVNNYNTNVNKTAVKYYQKQVAKFEKTVTKLVQQEEELYKTDYFKELADWEEKHNLVFHGLKDEEKAPEGAKFIENIQVFGIGIVNDKKGSFEGIYKKAYVEGFDKLTEEEQKEYTEKLEKALKWCKQTQEFEEKVLGKEIDKLQNAIILYNASSDGILTDNFRSKEKCDEVIARYRLQNPYLEQIQKLEQQLNKERLKLNQDVALISELDNMLKGLYQISEQWRLRFASGEEQNGSGKANFRITGNFTGIHSDENGEDYFVTSESVNLSYGNQKTGINVNAAIDDKYASKDDNPESNFQSAYKIGLSSRYNSDNQFSVNHSSMLNINDSFRMQNHQLRLTYWNTTLALAENIRNMESGQSNPETNPAEQTSSTVAVTSAEISQQIGNVNTSGSIQFAPEGTTYGLNAGFNYSKNMKNLSLQLNPTAGGSYLPGQEGDVYTASAGLNAQTTYRNRIFEGGLAVNENFNTQFPTVNNNLTVSANAKIKGIGFSVSNTNMYSSQQKMNTIAAGINYKGKYGEAETSYSYSCRSTQMPDETGAMSSKTDNSSKFIISASIYLDKILTGKK